MALKTFNETYQLTNENIDRIAGRIAEYLTELDMERSNIVRIRLMMEEALLRWQDHFGPESEVRVILDVRLRRQLRRDAESEAGKAVIANSHRYLKELIPVTDSLTF